MSPTLNLPGVEILAPVNETHAQILTPDALDFIVDLHRTFNPRRKELLAGPPRAPEAPRRRREAGLPRRDPLRSASPNGPSRPSPPTSWIAASRSPAPSTAR